MNFSFELSGALITGNMNQDAMMGMGAVVGAVLGGLAIVRMVIALAIASLMIISRWRIFTKAGLPGWGIFIPFYNWYLMFQLGGRSGWNFLWILIPPVFVILMIINVFKITERFGKHWSYGLGIIFLKVIFIPILAFDDSKYLNKKTVAKATTTHIPTPKIIAKATPVKTTVKRAPAKKVKTITKKK